ncbi:MAG: hypothetical protein ABJA57_05100 [Ginsengibacter sp.]
MKTSIFYITCFFIISCSKTTDTAGNLDASDAAAVSGMINETNILMGVSTQLEHAVTSDQIHHLDNLYDEHDSIFWHHHNSYNEANNQPHNDHTHAWVPYDPSIDHSHHFHPAYPDHFHDSLVEVPNNHHADYNIYHPDIHSLHDHHVIDSLEHLHQLYHHH